MVIISAWIISEFERPTSGIGASLLVPSPMVLRAHNDTGRFAPFRSLRAHAATTLEVTYTVRTTPYY